MFMNQKIIRGFSNLKPKQKHDLLLALKTASEMDVTFKLMHELFNSGTTSSDVKESILSILFKVKNKKSTNIFLKLFEEKETEPHLFPYSIWFLSTVTSDKALEFMIGTVKSSPDLQKREDAAYILQGYNKDKRAINVLIEVLNDKNQPSEVRAQAAESLGRIGDNRQTPILVQHLNDESVDIQFWCIYALWQVCMDTSVIPKLEKFIGNKTIIGSIFIVEEEAKAAVRFIKARGKALEKYEDKSKVSIWDIHEEVLLEVERVEKETGETYKDMNYYKERDNVPSTR